MPEVLGNPPIPRTALFWNGTAWQWALVDAAGNLQVDVLSTVMDVAAATAANQALILAQVQAIEDLRDALQSVATDRLIVRGEDQLHSFRGLLVVARTAAISGANGYIDSLPGLADRVWVITSVAVRDSTNAVTAVEMLQRHGADQFRFHNEVLALPAGQWYTLQCLKWLGEDDVIRIYLSGAQAGDSCIVNLTGHYMHKET